jgi:hypothetical protein
LRMTFLFAKLAGSAFGRMDSSGPHFYAKVAKKVAAAEPLCVLPSEMSPFGVPSEESLLEGGQVRRLGLRDALKSERFCSG